MKQHKSRYEIFRQKVNIVVHGVNTPAGKLFDIILLILILFSVVLVMLESVERMDVRYHEFFFIAEWVITIFFTIEYILRIISTDKKPKYILSFYGIIDLISILPMYLSFFLPGSQMLSIIRALRLLRLFRVLNLVQFSGQQSQLKLAINASKTKIIVFIYFVLIISVLLGSVMYVIESPHNGFTSIPTSIYWCIVTLTTVGYGDIAPGTPLGKIIASFIMILGYGIIAVPTGIVTAELASQRKTRLLPNGCVNCGVADHRSTAEFCYKCGHYLEDQNKMT